MRLRSARYGRRFTQMTGREPRATGSAIAPPDIELSDLWQHNERAGQRYILDLLLSVTNLSVQTMDTVDSLPTLDLSAGAER